MPRLNYRHLEYFWHVAKHGSVTAAAEALHVSQPAVSAQLRKLERALGHDLFERDGRGLSLTAEGRIVFEYADEIFHLGDELQSTVHGGLAGRPMRLSVGLAATIPNLVGFHLLEPVFELEDPVRVEVRESRTDRLLSALASRQLDLVLSDMPLPSTSAVRAFSHKLGNSPIDILAPPLMAYRLRDDFPNSLDGAPIILPAEGYRLRKSLDDWFATLDIHPHVFAEVEDNDLINVLAEAGAGLFAAPAVITDDIRVRYAVEVVGRAEGLTEEYYAITAERRLKHPAVVAITEGARRDLFHIDPPGDT